MKQGLIVGLVLIIISMIMIGYLFNSNRKIDDLQTVIYQDGEQLYQTDTNQDQIIWYVEEEDGEQKILVNQEIIDYYNFDLTIDELAKPENIDYQKITKISGQDAKYNMILQVDSKVSIYEANCDDKICIKLGTIENDNQLLTCAPHKLVVKIEGSGDLDA